MEPADLLPSSSGASATVQAPPVVLLRFSGSGWLLAFLCGVGRFLQEHLDVTSQRLRFAGQSGSSLICAALATGMDVDTIYEESLDMYERCKRNPFRTRTCLMEALYRLAPPEEAWAKCNQRLVVGLSQRQSGGMLGKSGFRAVTVSEFRGRQHALQVLEASCQVPVISGVRGVLIDGERYCDGGLTQLVPDVSPKQIGLDADTGRDAHESVVALDICAWGRPADGLHICPGFDVPAAWYFLPHNPSVLHKLYLLGYCRAAECFAKLDPWLTAGLWRPGQAVGPTHLTSIVEQICELLEELREAGPVSRIGSLLAFRKKHSQPRPEELEALRVPQVALPETRAVLAQVAKLLLPPTEISLPETPTAVVAFEKARQVVKHKRTTAIGSSDRNPVLVEPKRASMHMEFSPDQHRRSMQAAAMADVRRKSLQGYPGDPRRSSIHVVYPVGDPRRMSMHVSAPTTGAAAAEQPRRAITRKFTFTSPSRQGTSPLPSPQAASPAQGPSRQGTFSAALSRQGTLCGSPRTRTPPPPQQQQQAPSGTGPSSGNGMVPATAAAALNRAGSGAWAAAAGETRSPPSPPPPPPQDVVSYPVQNRRSSWHGPFDPPSPSPLLQAKPFLTSPGVIVEEGELRMEPVLDLLLPAGRQGSSGGDATVVLAAAGSGYAPSECPTATPSSILWLERSGTAGLERSGTAGLRRQATSSSLGEPALMRRRSGGSNRVAPLRADSPVPSVAA